MFEIEDGIEVPKTHPSGPTGKSKYPFGLMEIGQSFLMPDRPITFAWSTISHWRYANKSERKFATRKADGGTRIWRVA